MLQVTVGIFIALSEVRDVVFMTFLSTPETDKIDTIAFQLEYL